MVVTDEAGDDEEKVIDDAVRQVMAAGARMLEHGARARARNRHARLERRKWREHERALYDAGVRHEQPFGRQRLAAVQ